MSRLSRFISLAKFLGLDPVTAWKNLHGIRRFFRDYTTLRMQLKHSMEFPFGKWYPVLHDSSESSGSASGAYFHQDLLVARRIYERNPMKHVDVGSRIDGFAAHVAAFRELEIFDIRPQSHAVRNIIFHQRDIMHTNGEFDEYTDSLSSLHALEHFGLGRYGDDLDAFGHVRGFEAMARMLRKGGIMYLSVPIGQQRIEFNAHRVFNVKYLYDMIAPLFDIQCFSYVNDAGVLFEDVKLSPDEIESNCGCMFGCGIFELEKLWT